MVCMGPGGYLALWRNETGINHELTREEGREDCEDGWETNLKPLACKTGMVGAALRSSPHLKIILVERR